MGLFKKKEKKERKEPDQVEAHAPIEQGHEEPEQEKSPVDTILRNQEVLAQNQQAIMKEIGEVKQGLVELYNRIEELAVDDEDDDDEYDEEPEPPKPPKKGAKKKAKRR